MVHTRAFYHEIDSMSSEEKTVWILQAMELIDKLDARIKNLSRKIIELGGKKDVDVEDDLHDKILEITTPIHSHSRKRRKTIGGKTRRRGKKNIISIFSFKMPIIFIIYYIL